MRKRFFILACLALALGIAWWAGRRDYGVDVEKPSMAISGTPEVGVPASGVGAAVPIFPAAPNNSLLLRMLNGEKLKLTLEQLQGYLRENHRDAESLLTAARLTGDEELVREAARRFPQDAHVHLELAMKASGIAEKQQAIAVLSANDPE
ncbi:MAG: hypothetical protein JWO08_4441, partial [Verrucomicrobiaceae bacterium]|nr:hypothetical protein [Verrucomicrobiaceae bacterium]